MELSRIGADLYPCPLSTALMFLPCGMGIFVDSGYSAVPNNRGGVWNNWGGLENFSKINNRGVEVMKG